MSGQGAPRTTKNSAKASQKEAEMPNSSSGVGSKSKGSKQAPPAASAEAQEQILALQNELKEVRAELLVEQEEKGKLAKAVEALRAEVQSVRSGGTAVQQLQQDLEELKQQAAAQTAAPASNPPVWAANSMVLEDMQKEIADQRQQLAAMGVSSEETAAAIKQTLEQAATAYIQLTTASNGVKELEKQTADLDAAYKALKRSVDQVLQWQQRHTQQQHRAEGALMAYAPADWVADRVGDVVCSAACVSQRSVVSVVQVWAPRPRQQQPGTAAAAVGGSGGAAAAGSRGAGGASSSGAGRQPLALWRLTVCDASLVPTMLGGRTRGNLRRQSLPVYVEAELSDEERQQRKALQAVRRRLVADKIRTRWQGAVLQQLVFDARGKRGTWEAVLPGPPQQQGAGADGAAATEEGEVPGAT